MFARSKSSDSQDDVAKSKAEESDGSLSQSSKAMSFSKLLTGRSQKGSSSDRESLADHIKHLDPADVDNLAAPPANTTPQVKQQTGAQVHCVTAAPYEQGCLLWEIEWNAIEIELKTKTTGVIRSVPLQVGGHSWFVELYPKVTGSKPGKAVSIEDVVSPASVQSTKSKQTKATVHQCKFNFFVKSSQIPIHAKFAVYYTKQPNNDKKDSWHSIYSPNILVFNKNGAGFDKIVNFSDLCSLCFEKKLRLKIEVQVFTSVQTNVTSSALSSVSSLKDRINQKCMTMRQSSHAQLLKTADTTGDVCLKCNGVNIYAHSAILSSFSSKFADLLNSKDEEAREEENGKTVINMAGNEWQTETVQGLVIFLYTQVLADDLDLRQMLDIGTEFQVEVLVLQCLFRWWMSEDDELKSSMLDILVWTQKYSHIEEVMEIEKQCTNYMMTHLSDIASNEQMDKIAQSNPQVFVKLLRSMSKSEQ